MDFEEFPSSPKSPLSSKKPWQGREDNRDCMYACAMLVISRFLVVATGY